MTRRDTSDKSGADAASDKEARLAKALRANLRRRKAAAKKPVETKPDKP